MDNVPFVKQKFMKKKSRSPFRISEKPIGLISELIDLFTPFGGSLSDPFACTLTIAIFVLRINRHCVVVKKNMECFGAQRNIVCFSLRIFNPNVQSRLWLPHNSKMILSCCLRKWERKADV